MFWTTNPNLVWSVYTENAPIDNGFRTKCIDPYTNYDLEMDSLIKPLVYIFGIIGACSTATVMVVFYWRRETPTVRPSDYQLSMVHLSSLTTTHNVGLSNFANLSNEMCVVRNLNISIFYCLNAAFIYTRSGNTWCFQVESPGISWRDQKNNRYGGFHNPYLVIDGKSLALCIIFYQRTTNRFLGGFWQMAPHPLLQRNLPSNLLIECVDCVLHHIPASFLMASVQRS